MINYLEKIQNDLDSKSKEKLEEFKIKFPDINDARFEDLPMVLLRAFTRKSGHSRTFEEKEQREAVRENRKNRKEQRRRLAQKRKEWRRLHRNRKTGDYDDYGPFDEKVALEEIQEEMEYEDYGDLSKVSGPGDKPLTPNEKRKNRREKRKNKKNAKQQKKDSKIQQTTEAPTTSTTLFTPEPTVETTPIATTIATTAFETKSQAPGRFDLIDEDLVFQFEAENFVSQTANNFAFSEYQETKRLSIESGDTSRNKALRKYERLMLMTLYLQDDNVSDWGTFSNYGCYCFQKFDENFWRGQGLPKDAIDKTCRELMMCYHCLDQDVDLACDPTTEYEFFGLEVNGDRRIQCRDPNGSCSRHICECDKRMAEGLRNNRDTLNVNYQRDEMDIEAECRPQIGQPKWDKCCGSYPKRYPYASQGSKGCCGENTYDKNFHQCCDENITSLGITCAATP